jgi:hypothetical protein
MRVPYPLTHLLPAFTLSLGLGIVAPTARADETAATPKLGDHPAIVVQRLQQHAGYDYAAQFYRHPAGLDLLPVAPQPDTTVARGPGARDGTLEPRRRIGRRRDVAVLPDTRLPQTVVLQQTRGLIAMEGAQRAR